MADDTLINFFSVPARRAAKPARAARPRHTAETTALASRLALSASLMLDVECSAEVYFEGSSYHAKIRRAGSERTALGYSARRLADVERYFFPADRPYHWDFYRKSFGV